MSDMLRCTYTRSDSLQNVIWHRLRGSCLKIRIQTGLNQYRTSWNGIAFRTDFYSAMSLRSWKLTGLLIHVMRRMFWKPIRWTSFKSCWTIRNWCNRTSWWLQFVSLSWTGTADKRTAQVYETHAVRICKIYLCSSWYAQKMGAGTCLYSEKDVWKAVAAKEHSIRRFARSQNRLNPFGETLCPWKWKGLKGLSGRSLIWCNRRANYSYR